MGGSVGIGLGYALGGYLGEVIGWRLSFVVVGLPGIALALIVRFGLREPPRGVIEGRSAVVEPPPLLVAIRTLLAIRSYRQITIATGLYCVASYGFIMWVPTFLMRVHDMGRTESGAWLGLIAAGMLAFLGVLDLAYFLRTGMFARERGGVANAGVVASVLALAVILVVRFL
jgi:predicted MFS family arabinose efflux permease